MSDRPILFSAPMVCALLAGTKTQTRRAVRWQGPKGFPHSFAHAVVDNPAGVQRLLVPYRHPDDDDTAEWGELGYHRHYGAGDPGDRFWVKEALKLEEAPSGIVYKAFAADSSAVPYVAEGWPWKVKRLPSMYMPKWASRLTLHVTGARVQRLQEISEADAIAEGVRRNPTQNDRTWMIYPEGSSAAGWISARRSYQSLWEDINGKGSWEANPWVFAYTFSVELAHIDVARAAA